MHSTKLHLAADSLQEIAGSKKGQVVGNIADVYIGNAIGNAVSKNIIASWKSVLMCAEKTEVSIIPDVSKSLQFANKCVKAGIGVGALLAPLGPIGKEFGIIASFGISEFADK